MRFRSVDQTFRGTLALVVGVLVTFAGLVQPPTAHAQERKPVRLIAEAEDFTPQGSGGWSVLPYYQNYYASTFAITFLSRLGALSAPAQIEGGGQVVAEQEVMIPYDDAYFVMARYEQPFDFSVEFTVEIVQGGNVVYSKTYGRLEDDKVWALNNRQRVPMERFWWGGTDNIVWQHFDREPLKGGRATIRLIAGPQMDGDALRANAAKRNVDVIAITNDLMGIEAQQRTRYLEYDGWLVQEGDLFLQVTLADDAEPTAINITPHNLGQHSPYYIHIRDWPSARLLREGYAITPRNYQIAGPRSDAVQARHLAKAIEDNDLAVGRQPIPEEQRLQPGQASGWVPIGGMIDALHNSKWNITVPDNTTIEFAIPDGSGGLKIIKTLTGSGPVHFEMPGNVAPNAALEAHWNSINRPLIIRERDEALNWLLAEINKFPKVGKRAERFFIYNIMGFSGGLNHPLGREIALALGDNTGVNQEGNKRRLVAHWRDPSVEWIKQQEESNPERFNDLYVVSYGDEIHLPAMQPTEEEFETFLNERGVADSEKGPYTTERDNPLYYYSRLAAQEKGGRHFAEGTAYYKSKGILTGANYSPHANYLVTEVQYIRTFKIGAMSMPWSEDYIWQIPEFSVQVMGYLTSAFRAGAKYHDNPIHMYVMPHSPGNTTASFRRSFYTTVGHGTTIMNYFCASPLVIGGTENYIATDDLEMWQAVHKVSHEAGLFEDYIMDGRVRQARVGLLLSSVDDILGNASNANLQLHNNERKAIYYALRHAQVPVDFLSEDDVIDGLAEDYDVIYVTQRRLHSRAVSALQSWAEAGGTVVAMAGGGFFNEFDKPNPAAGQLYGVRSQQLEADPDLARYLINPNRPFLSKQDLPRYEPIDHVTVNDSDVEPLGVIAWKQTLSASDGTVRGTFSDGSPAIIEKQHGQGRAILFGFLPGQAYLKSGLPLRPVDRGSHDDAYTHYLPTTMNQGFRQVMVDHLLPESVVRPVVCSEPLVESMVIDTTQPRHLMAVSLVNFTPESIGELEVRIRDVASAQRVRSLERGDLQPRFEDGDMIVTMPLDEADMLLIDR